MNYRVDMFYYLYLSVSGIFIKKFKSIGQFKMSNLRKRVDCCGRIDIPMIIESFAFKNDIFIIFTFNIFKRSKITHNTHNTL